MSKPSEETVRATDLPIALYLNQRVTFDLLAALEDGFAQMTTVQESSTDTQRSGLEAGAGLGISNPFAFLGLRFGAAGRRDSTSQASGVTTEELVHTPTSLFARLRKELYERDLVKPVDGQQASLAEIAAGDFVEVQAILRRSPLIAILNSVRGLVPMMEAFGVTGGQAPEPDRPKRQRGKASRNAKNTADGSMPQLVKQIDTLLDAVTADGSEDLIAECGPTRFVLTAETKYFVDPTMNDVIDGTFRIFGKVTRVVPADADEGISLLRKSPAGNIGGLPERLESAFASLPQNSLVGRRPETEIPPPTLQMIPIGIFA